MLFFSDNAFATASTCIHIGSEGHCIGLGVIPVPDESHLN